MSQIVTFGNTVLQGTGKRGILKPMDSSGYYLMNAGGFNIPNRGGVTYRFNDYLKECMGPDSDLNRRVSEGQVMMELGHPTQYYLEKIQGQVVRTQITDVFQWIMRLKTVIQDRVCGHIRKIHWELTGGNNDPIYNRVEVTPFGPYKETFKDSLENPDINTAISIRTVTKPHGVGDRVWEVEHFSTYDLVPEPGMLNACKHRTAGLEELIMDPFANQNFEMTASLEEVIFVCDKNLQFLKQHERVGGMESLNTIEGMLKDIKKNLSDKKKVQLVKSNSLDVFR